MVFHTPTAGSLRSLVSDHVVHGSVIFPAAGYLEAARAAGETELHNVHFLQPLAVEAPGKVIECAVICTHFEVRSSGDDGACQDMAVHCSGTTGSVWTCKPVGQKSRCVSSFAIDVRQLYDLFNTTCLQYGPSYRTLMHAWGGETDASARLKARVRRDSTQVHPADLDDAMCTCAVTSLRTLVETHLPYAMDSSQLQGVAGKIFAVQASHILHTCTYIRRPFHANEV